MDRDYEELVRESVTYWSNARVAKYGAYNVSLQYVTDEDDPDIEVRIRDEINCGEDHQEAATESLGCAPIIKPDVRVQTAGVDIFADQNNRYLKHTVRHEIGHVLGLEHDADPEWLMSHSNATGNATDAWNRSQRWNGTQQLRITVANGAENHDQMNQTLKEVAEYYNERPALRNGMGNVIVVGPEYRADVVYRTSEPPNTTLNETTILYNGLDHDSDPAIEQLMSATVVLDELDSDDRQRYAGYWLGRLLGNDRQEIPRRYR